MADGAVYVLNASLFHTDRTWEEYREEHLTPQLDSTDLTPEELEAHYYGLWQQQSAAPQVYRLTDDGKTCIDLPAECVDYVFDFCDDAALYGMTTSGNNGQNTKAVRVDLTTGALQSVPLEPTEYFVTCYDGALLTARYVTDAPLPDDFEQFRAAVQSATVEFDRYDPRTGERRKLIERPYNIADERLSGYLGTHNGKLYFEEREALQGGGYNRGALQEYDPADGKIKRIRTHRLPVFSGFISLLQTKALFFIPYHPLRLPVKQKRRILFGIAESYRKSAPARAGRAEQAICVFYCSICIAISSSISTFALLQILFSCNHHVEKTVLHTQFPKACPAMGFPCGDFVPGDREVVMDPENAAITERVIQHQPQRGNGIPLAAVGSIHHDAHIPPIFFGRIVEIHIADPCAI